MRSLATVQRTSLQYGSPFFGLSRYNDDRLIGPNHCVDCNNVILQHGTIRRRHGFSVVEGAEIPVGHLIEGVVSYPYREFLTSGIPQIQQRVGYIIVGNGRILQSSGEPGEPWTVLGLQKENAEKIPNFFFIGLSGKDIEDTEYKGYGNAIYILDGGDRMFKKAGGPSGLFTPLGISTPTVLSVVNNALGTGGLVTGDQYDARVTLSDRSQAPEGTPALDPGQESNASDSFTQTGNTATGDHLRVLFTFPSEEEHWTHARLYLKNTATSETTFRFVGQFARPGWEEPDEDSSVLVVTNPGEYQIVYRGTVADDIPTGVGPYDYAPTRNHVPENMHHFSFYRGRGFWANKFKRFVYYSDVVGASTGGHYEALSREFLPPMDGPVTMLASFFDQLVIGTPFGLTILTGVISSHTNASIARDEDISTFPASIGPVPDATIGPIFGGTGTSVIADGLLYYVTSDGLEAYDGRRTFNVSRGIRDRFDAPLGRDLSKVYLVHDTADQIIYMMVRLDNDSSPFESTSQMFCYHYRIRDPDTGVGSWTRWRHVARHQVYTAIGPYYPSVGESARIMLANRDIFGLTNGSWILFNDPEAVKDFLGSDSGIAYTRTVDWFWQTGQINAGLMDRRKRFYFLSVDIERFDGDGAEGGSLSVGVAIDGEDPKLQATEFSQDTRRLKSRIGLYGNELSIRFGNGSGSTRSRISGFALDVQPVGSF